MIGQSFLAAILCGKKHAYTLLMAVALLKSAYFLTLSTNSKRWHEAKLSNTRLSVDRYVIKDCYHSLGEACSHIAAILTCVINASEARKQAGYNSCTSHLCSWLPSPNDVCELLIYNGIYM